MRPDLWMTLDVFAQLCPLIVAVLALAGLPTWTLLAGAKMVDKLAVPLAALGGLAWLSTAS